jgi:hypothetical protein
VLQDAGLLLAAFIVCDPIIMNAISNTASKPTKQLGDLHGCMIGELRVHDVFEEKCTLPEGQ